MMTTNSFIAKSISKFGDIFDYSKVEYKGYFTNVIIICKICNQELIKTPSNHFISGKCKFCAIRIQTLTTDQFLIIAHNTHGDKYDYSKTKYINAKHKLEIICNKCKQSFLQLPRSHVYGKSGCPKCRFSKGELAISEWLIKNQIPFVTNYKFENCMNVQPLPFDFYIEKFNICIEFDGKQHYEKKSKYYTDQLIKNDLIKTEFCKGNKITLIRIPYWDYKNISKILVSEFKNPKIIGEVI